MSNNMVEIANFYKNLNFSIVPLISNDKMVDPSLLKDLSNGMEKYQKQIALESEIKHWFDGKLTNIGIVCGYNNLMVLDFDDIEAFSHWKKLYSTLSAQTVIQKTNKGYHVFFYIRNMSKKALLARNFSIVGYKNKNKIGQLQWKGDHVAVWPSCVNNNEQYYTWLDKNAPWEVNIKSIDSLKDIGIYLKVHWLSFTLRWFLNPRSNFKYLSYLYTRAIGKVNRCQ